MRCLMCEAFSVSHICQKCRDTHLVPQLASRTLPNGITVYSFYRYEEIAPLLHAKHSDLGYYIFSILAQQSFTHFAKAFSSEETVAAIAVDDHTRSGYSHTAILAKALASETITPRYGLLRAGARHHYSGKSLSYRESHPRRFTCKAFKEASVIVVDDIITTGVTLHEATQTLISEGKTVLCALTLAHADLEA